MSSSTYTHTCLVSLDGWLVQDGSHVPSPDPPPPSRAPGGGFAYPPLRNLSEIPVSDITLCYDINMFAVSCGEYSYYTVYALFPTRELAEQHLADLGEQEDGYQPFIEEFRYFDRLPIRVTWYEIHLRMNADGSYPPKPDVLEREGWEYEAPVGVSMRPRTELLYSEPYVSNNASSPTVPPTMSPGQYGLFGHSLDKTALQKAASDTLAQWRAQDYTLHNAKPWADQIGLV